MLDEEVSIGVSLIFLLYGWDGGQVQGACC